MSPPGLRLVDALVSGGTESKEPASVALIGNYPPRRCGIATFTADVRQALTLARPDLRCDVFAMTDEGRSYDYPAEVTAQIRQQHPADYKAAAGKISALRPDVIFVQHEFGIFGGSAGEHLLLLLDAVDRPVVSLLHTVLDQPNHDQRRVFERLLARSSRLIVMAEHGREMLRRVWGVADEKISVIPHGAPERVLEPTDAFKDRLGFGGHELLFTFGLLSPNKGIETVIRALPAIVAARPTALYAVLGATHPHLIAHEGERYRNSLLELAHEMGVAQHLRLIDEFTDTPKLLDYLQAADVYVTPYLNAAQITSGTLSYAAALGRPTVSTPYWHAEELLADGGGRLVPFSDSRAIAHEVVGLLSNDDARAALSQRIYDHTRPTIWSCFAERSLAVLGKAMTQPQRRAAPAVASTAARAPRPEPTLEGVQRMTDSCGMLQHSLFDIPDRRHGYCVDDNARALLLMLQLPGPITEERRRLTGIFAAFVQHAWNPDRGRFRNFMSYERHWLEDEGSEDSTGRAFWSVAIAAARARDPGLRRWAHSLAGQVLPHLQGVTSPRTVAFVLLGLSAMIEAGLDSEAIRNLAKAKLDILEKALGARLRAGQPWFEETLAYDNARLPEAMIRTGLVLKRQDAVDAGVMAMAWLCRRQTSPEGFFLPVATADFGLPLGSKSLFDQQPVEATATIDACEAAFLATHDRQWVRESERAFAWYYGANTLGAMIAAPLGECFDGLTWDGPNENKGAESVLSLQLAACVHRRLTDGGADGLKAAADL